MTRDAYAAGPDLLSLAAETLAARGTDWAMGLAAEIERGRRREPARHQPVERAVKGPAPRRPATEADDQALLRSGALFAGGLTLPTGRVLSPEEVPEAVAAAQAYMTRPGR